MKFTIMGFSQEKLKELELDLTDSLILRWFVDFKDSGSMATEIFEDDKYYWIKYEYLLQEIPIININNKKTLGRRLKDLTDKGILKQYIKKKGGIFTFYTLGDKYKLLISNHLVTQKSQGYALESHKGSDSKVTTKDSSTKETNLLNNQSTKYPKEKKEKETDFDKMINEFTLNEELKETIIEFIKMRKTIKKNMTSRALELMLSKLKKISLDEEIQINILNNSILNCWQDIYELKNNNDFNIKNIKSKSENKNQKKEYNSKETDELFKELEKRGI